MATRDVLAALVRAYRRGHGDDVAITSVGGVDAKRRVESGEAFDFVVLAAEAIGELERSGRVDGESRVELARSPVALAVRAGARAPDMTSEAAVRDAVLGARSIGYSTGPSGVHVVRLFERWGIAERVAPRIVQAAPGVPVGTLIARGEVELGFQQLSELIEAPGVEVVGVLPPPIEVITVFAAAVCRASSRADAARAFLSFAAGPHADAAKRRHGMQPARAEASGDLALSTKA